MAIEAQFFRNGPGNITVTVPAPFALLGDFLESEIRDSQKRCQACLAWLDVGASQADPFGGSRLIMTAEGARITIMDLVSDDGSILEMSHRDVKGVVEALLRWLEKPRG